MGELSLDGSLQAVKGVLPIAIHAKKEGFKGILLPYQNANEAAIVQDFEVYGFHHLKEVIAFLKQEENFSPVSFNPEIMTACPDDDLLDFKDVKGQENVKRAMEVAAAGGHNMIMIGSPGSGKTMLSRRLPTILPPMTIEEALETTKIHSVAGKTKIIILLSLFCSLPFHIPHTISDVALVGGGSWPQPGEISSCT